MKKTGYLLGLTLLLSCTFSLTADAQQITFDFTAGTLADNLQSWTNTVDGITCTAVFNDDSLGENYAVIGRPPLTSANGLWAGLFNKSDADTRLGQRKYGATLTFSEDVRLKSYTLGQNPNDELIGFITGGNVTAVAGFIGGDASGTRNFDMEALIPANTPVDTTSNNDSKVWRIGSLTVEREDYVEPIIDIPAGNATGVTKVGEYTFSGGTVKINHALKNGQLYRWGSTFVDYESGLVEGGESGVRNFWLSQLTADADYPCLIETVEGFVLFEVANNGFGQLVFVPLSGTLPANPDQVAITQNADHVAVVIALKDGQVSFDGPGAATMRAEMPDEIAAGGVSHITAGLEVAAAVKNGQLYVWGSTSSGSLSGLLHSIPTAVTQQEVLDIAAAADNFVTLLADGTLLDWGAQDLAFSTEQTTPGSGIVAIQTYEHNVLAIKDDGTFLLNNVQQGSAGTGYPRYGSGPYYVNDGDGVSGSNDFNLRGLEIPPPILQKVGWTEVSLGSENMFAITPSGHVIVWGGVDFDTNSESYPNPVYGDAVPPRVNEVIFPQTNVAQWVAPTEAEFISLGAGRLGIQWGSNTQYEIQTTTDMLDSESWTPLPTDANNRFYRITPINP
jgi:alpha-tubulin suppressor-like RCC1 family protein